MLEITYEDLVKEYRYGMSECERRAAYPDTEPSKVNFYAEVEEYFEQGFTQRQVAAILGKHEGTLYSWRRRGLLGPLPSKVVDDKEIIMLRERMLSIDAIVKRTGHSHDVVRRVLHRHYGVGDMKGVY
jgi:hypothetical protein